MVYLVLIYALIYTLGEFVSRRIGLPHSVTFAGLAVFLAAALILYRRRYGLGACRRGRKRWPGLLLLLLWPAGDLVLAACGRSAAADGFFTCGMYVVCGMAEELAFRGYLWEHTQRLRPLTAAVLNAAVFGVFHAVNLIGGAPGAVGIQAVCAACAGFALCGTVAYYRSIVPALGIHALINLFGGLFPADDLRGAGLLVSGFCAACSVLVGLWMLRAEENGKHETVH